MLKEPATRTRPTRVSDGRGGHVTDFTNATPVPIGSCMFAPAAPQDLEGDREHGVRYAGTIYASPDVDVLPGDALTIRENRYRVIGEPQRWRPGTVIQLEHWEG